MEDTSKANIIFNISGGNNQILPNAIKAEQNFYGDKYIRGDDEGEDHKSRACSLTRNNPSLLIY